MAPRSLQGAAPLLLATEETATLDREAAGAAAAGARVPLQTVTPSRVAVEVAVVQGQLAPPFAIDLMTTAACCQAIDVTVCTAYYWIGIYWDY